MVVFGVLQPAWTGSLGAGTVRFGSLHVRMQTPRPPQPGSRETSFISVSREHLDGMVSDLHL
jgi:hypothetical protein